MGKKQKDFWKNWSGFYIHSFMLELGLSNTVLMVYAMIYSFSTRGEGLCYADNCILAKRLGISKRTVDRAVDVLFSKELIKKTVSGDYYGYTVKDIPETSRDVEFSVMKEENTAKKRNAEKKTKPHQRDIETSSPKTSPCPAPVKDEFKEYYGEEIAEDVPIHPKKMNKLWRENDPYDLSEILIQLRKDDPILMAEHLDEGEDFYEDMLYDPDDIPKHIFRSYGHKGYVYMTREQYEDLYSLVQPEILAGYLARLEAIIEKCDQEETRQPRNHYRLIRKWIDEDTSVRKKKR